LGLPITKRTEKGNVKMDNKTLQEYAGKPEVQEVLDYRKREKILNTYIRPYLEIAHETGRIYPQYNFSRTTSGRVICSKPNIQQVPKNLRYVVIPDRGHVYITADYSAAEVFTMVFYSQDRTLIKYLRDDVDFHSLWAGNIFGKDRADEKRKVVKNGFVFSTFYGAGAKRVAKSLDITEREARHYQNSLWQMFPKVKEFQDRTKAKYYKTGYIDTLIGRRLRGVFTHVALMNLPIQSLASDITVYCVGQLIKAGFDVRHFVHDSVTVQVSKDKAEQEKERFVDILTRQHFDWQILPMRAEAEITDVWI